MGVIRRELWIFCKAQLTAQLASVVDFAVTIVLKEVFGIWYFYATCLGALSGGITNGIMNYRWVFDVEGLQKKYIVLKYLIVWTGSIVLNSLGTFFITESTPSNYLFSKIIMAVVVAILWNYQLQRLFVYRDAQIIKKKNKKNIPT